MTREEAINLIKQVLPCLNIDEKIREGFVTLIPELAESEDERIRKCIGMALTDVNEQRFNDYGVTLKDCLAYLEKQKECVIDNIKTSTDDDERIRKEIIKFIQDYCNPCDPECDKWIAWLEKQKEQKPVDYEAELKKCKDNPLYFYDKYVSIKQKPAEWSEEEKQILHSFEVICQRLIENPHGEKFEVERSYAKKMLSWLKSIYPQPKQEWSEEDEGELQNAIDALEFLGKKGVYKSESGYDATLQAASWLKNLSLSLKKKNEDVAKLCSNEWSEEDEKHINNILNIIDYWKATTHFVSYQGGTIDADINWLKSFHPQYHGDVTMTEAYKMGLEVGKASSWKPSEHQMNILKAVKEYVGRGSGYWGEALGSLIEDLEKL